MIHVHCNFSASVVSHESPEAENIEETVARFCEMAGSGKILNSRYDSLHVSWTSRRLTSGE